MRNEIVCINCPIGCRLDVTLENGEVSYVNGAGCKRGTDYAKAEFINPTRIVTSTIKLNGSILKRLPVKTEKPITKNKIYECIINLKGVEANAPVNIGDIIVENICNTGINIIAARSSKEEING